ncbi:GDP-fucose protein O-fucosyltransferase 1 [Trichinella pseudospiralis]|uniref:GDP-fucose protein O-fucosyltransferase 1 n=1 Tax=Trichinella pseudospiralis TaxID=6337 RepID=A0A0V1DYB0_TRIPS|nr:GDP-fucose protein O-fucosyltransferase 1 [Trichinella pseudospiralis]
MTSSKSYKYVKLDSEPSTSFASRTIEQQELIIKSQDENLEKIGANVRVLRDMSAKIGFEIEEQSIMLDDLNADLDSTQAKMATVMNKMGKVMHMSAGKEASINFKPNISNIANCTDMNLIVRILLYRMRIRIVLNINRSIERTISCRNLASLFLIARQWLLLLNGGGVDECFERQIRMAFTFVLMWIGIVVFSLFILVAGHQKEIDGNGYLVYCPCMGRFGNQVEQFLGTLSFAKHINRTLVLPPFIEYDSTQTKMIRFTDYFQLKPLLKYHRAIEMSKFIRDVAPVIWPMNRRIGFCYYESSHSNGCDMKYGNPFQAFWDLYNVDFVSYEIYSKNGLTTDRPQWDLWLERYPAKNYPVLAFKGAPGAFPSNPEDHALQKYLVWTPNVQNKADTFISENLRGQPFLGVHLRNNRDWPNVCQYIKPKWHLFCSSQCLGKNFEHGIMTMELCLPSEESILSQVKEAIARTGLKVLFVASEYNHMINQFTQILPKKEGYTVARRYPDHAQISLAILAKSKLFICNCLSSFTAMVKRQRDLQGLPTEFWGFNNTQTKQHDEL